MYNPNYISKLSQDLLSGNLLSALNETITSPTKRVFQTETGVRALTPLEAKTAGNVHLIAINELNSVFNESKLELAPNAQSDFAKILQVYAKAMGIPLKLDENHLKHIAEVEGFGYKPANLDQVSMLCSENFGPYRLKVPEYEKISKVAVQDAFKRVGFDLNERWKGIIEKHFSGDEIQEEIFKTKKFPPAFLADCGVFQQEIRDAVKKIKLDVKDSSLNEIFGSPNLDPFVEKLKHSGQKIMIRSAGKEDTRQYGNAGGNTSVSNVAANCDDVLKFFEETIVSYFGEKSLKQRLNALDQSLFEKNAFTPFFIQRMIGEKNPHALPKCGVMFTEDVQSKKQGHTNTSGIMVINSAYGHNDAVVNAEIPVDTFYVTKERNIFPIITPKTYRKIPSEKSGHLSLVANPSNVVKTSSLSKEAILTLKNFAERLEQFYSGPMDVEFVVDEQENTIYIVQARPLVEKEFAESSYISDFEALKDSITLKGSSIDVAGGALLLAKPSEIIAATHIKEASDQYLDSDNKPAIKAVITGKNAPVTSHYATVFHNDGLPVIYIEDLPTFKSWMSDQNTQILLSPQQGAAVNLNSDTEVTLEDLIRNGALAKGWIDYPAPAHLSTSLEFRPTALLTEEAIKALHPVLQDPKKWAFFQEHALNYNFETLFERIRLAHGEDLQMLLGMLLYKFMHVLKTQSVNLKMDKERLSSIASLGSYALMLAENIQKNGNVGPDGDSYSNKLLPIHFLHALIFSQSLSEELVNHASLTTVALQDMREESLLAAKIKAQGITLKSPYSLPLLRLNKLILTPETAERFERMVLTLDILKKENELKILSKIVIDLDKIDLLAIWLNLTFPKSQNLESLVFNFVKHASYFKDLAEKKKMLIAMNVTGFENVHSFPSQWQEFIKESVEYIQSDRFFDGFGNSDTAGKLAAISLMNRTIDKFDQIIKTIERSPEFSLEQKLSLFKDRLKDFNKLAENLLESCNFPLKKEIKKRLDHANYMLNQNRNLTKNDLEFSKLFDGSAYSSRSGALIGAVTYPQTLEDLFSAIHQELLTILSLLNQQAIGKELKVPKFFANAIQQLELPQKGLNGIDLDSHGLIYHFTKILRGHGVQYTLESPLNSKELKLGVRYSAQNEWQRWDKIAEFITLLKIHGKFDVNDVQLTSKGLDFTFSLNENDNLQSLKLLLLSIEEASSTISDERLAIEKMAVIRPFDQILNSKRNLEPLRDERLILQVFEKNLGFAKMLNSSFVQKCVESLIEKDKAFVERLMKRSWQIEKPPIFFGVILPELLMKSGSDGILSFARGISLLQTQNPDSIKQGLRLMSISANKTPAVIADDSSKPLLLLLNEKIDKQTFEMALELITTYIKEGKDGAIILENALALSQSKDAEKMQKASVLLELFNRNTKAYPEEFQSKLAAIKNPES